MYKRSDELQALIDEYNAKLEQLKSDEEMQEDVKRSYRERLTELSKEIQKRTLEESEQAFNGQLEERLERISQKKQEYLNEVRALGQLKKSAYRDFREVMRELGIHNPSDQPFFRSIPWFSPKGAGIRSYEVIEAFERGE